MFNMSDDVARCPSCLEPLSALLYLILIFLCECSSSKQADVRGLTLEISATQPPWSARDLVLWPHPSVVLLNGAGDF